MAGEEETGNPGNPSDGIPNASARPDLWGGTPALRTSGASVGLSPVSSRYSMLAGPTCTRTGEKPVRVAEGERSFRMVTESCQKARADTAGSHMCQCDIIDLF